MAALHRWPAALPLLRLDGMGFEHQAVAEVFEPDTGERRHRQRFSTQRQTVAAHAKLSQGEFDAFDAWFEGDLRAGAVPFDLQLPAQGGTGARWWTAQVDGSYEWQALVGDLYIVSLRLLLVAGPSLYREAPGLHGRAGVVTRLRAAAPAAGVLRGRAPVATALRGALALPLLKGRSATATELRATAGRRRLRLAGGGHLLLAGGGKVELH